MSAPINDGGPAFPKDQERGTHGDVIEHAWPGMSLRDYFAAKAMHAEIVTSAGDTTPEAAEALVDAAARSGRTIEQQIAFNAYAMADAMLKARTA